MDLTGKNIVTVDDDVEFSQSIKNYLEDLNINVTSFNDGTLIFDYLKENTGVDLLLVDIRMPQISGLEILKKLQQMKIDLPVIVISATNDVQTAIQAVKAGAADFLSKPIYDLGELDICISRTLQQAADKKELEEYRHGLERLVKEKTEELTIQIEKTKIA